MSRDGRGFRSVGHALEHLPDNADDLRNTALTLLQRLGFKPAEGFEHFSEQRQTAIDAVSRRRTE